MLHEQDIARLRAETPGTAVGAYFNHAAGSLPPLVVTDAIIDHLRREALHGPYAAATMVQDRLDAMRADAAFLLRADPDEIAVTSSGSAGWGLAFAALPPLRSGDRVLVGRHEWGGSLATLKVAADASGARIDIIPCRPDGGVDPKALTAMIDDRVRLIALTWLPANGGLINDVAAIGREARRHDIPYFVDAAQALGQMPVDVAAIGCDVLIGSGRKFLRGPRGTALLYVRRGFLPRLRPAFLDVLSAPWQGDGPAMRADARRFETSETPIALWLGLGAALALARAIGIEAIRLRTRDLAETLRGRLAEIPKVRLRDLGGSARSALVAFTIDGIEAQIASQRLAAEHGIAVRAIGAAYTPLDMAARGLGHVIRASVSYLNTDDEIDRLACAIAKLAE